MKLLKIAVALALGTATLGTTLSTPASAVVIVKRTVIRPGPRVIVRRPFVRPLRPLVRPGPRIIVR